MKFENFEGASPADQFDRLGNKEDLDFLSKKLPEELNNTTEKLSYKEEIIKSTKAKIASLKEAIKTTEAEEEILDPEVLREQYLDLQEAEANLKVLESNKQDSDKKKSEDQDLQAKLTQQPYQN